jgi:O-succinylhomoserine sulfhydrylase
MLTILGISVKCPSKSDGTCIRLAESGFLPAWQAKAQNQDRDGRMFMPAYDEFSFATRAVRAGQRRTPEGEHAEAIFPTSSYVFGSAAEAAARFAGDQPGNIYSRFTNPTVRTFEERLASLEGGESCVATASGMAAILATCASLLKSGDHIVSSHSIFGTTTALFTNYLARFGIETSFVPLTDIAAWEEAIRPETRLMFLETPSNPLTDIADLRQLASLARTNDCLLVVDNCFCTPALQRPLALGADIVIHSATKYLDGQGRCIGGAVVGDAERVGKDVYGFLRTAGPSMSPFNAWIFLKGLETLSLRMQAHCSSALELAVWLEQQPGISRVYHPGLASHPQHTLAAIQQDGFGGIVSLELEGGRGDAWKFIDATRIFSITANLGDAKSTITHPATTTHGRLTPEQRQASGITEGLIRLAIGLENTTDLRHDLERGLAAVKA